MIPKTPARFELVRVRTSTPKRRIATMVVVTLLLAGGIAAASAISVKQRQDTASLFAERLTVGELFMLVGSGLAPSASAFPAEGVLGLPVEMGPAMPVARTATARDHWTYGVTVHEISGNAISGGQFIIELHVDGIPRAGVYVSQSTSDAAVEGVRAIFDIGDTVQTSSLYYVVVRPHVPSGSIVNAAVRSNPNGNLSWLGVGGSVEGVVAPTFALASGDTLRITATNADDILHNIGIKSGTTVITPPGWSPNIGSTGEEVILSWIPTAPGAYTYQCQYHAAMKGNIVVS